MIKTLIASLVVASALCSPAMAQKLGRGDYIVHELPEEEIVKLFPERLAANPELLKEVHERSSTTRDFDVMQIIDNQCRKDQKEQAPGMVKDVLLPVVRAVPFYFAGGVAGAAAGGLAFAGSPIRELDYGKNAAAQGGGGTIAGAINAAEIAKHVDVAGCVSNNVQIAQSRSYIVRNVSITISTHAARGHPVRREDFRPYNPEAVNPPSSSSPQVAKEPEEVQPMQNRPF